MKKMILINSLLPIRYYNSKLYWQSMTSIFKHKLIQNLILSVFRLKIIIKFYITQLGFNLQLVHMFA